jgi:small-conductance mechanosensitive channel
VNQVTQILCGAASVNPRVLKDPGPVAHLGKLGADGLEFNLFFWIEDPANGQFNVRSDVNVRILEGLRAAGIDIPYPQRVVHLKTPPEGAATPRRTEATS